MNIIIYYSKVNIIDLNSNMATEKTYLLSDNKKNLHKRSDTKTEFNLSKLKIGKTKSKLDKDKKGFLVLYTDGNYKIEDINLTLEYVHKVVGGNFEETRSIMLPSIKTELQRHNIYIYVNDKGLLDSMAVNKQTIGKCAHVFYHNSGLRGNVLFVCRKGEDEIPLNGEQLKCVKRLFDLA